MDPGVVFFILFGVIVFIASILIQGAVRSSDEGRIRRHMRGRGYRVSDITQVIDDDSGRLYRIEYEDEEGESRVARTAR